MPEPLFFIVMLMICGEETFKYYYSNYYNGNTELSVTEIKSKPILQIPEDECPECESTNLIFDHIIGETICKGCGLVTQDIMMDRGPEWRAFTQEDKDTKTRVGIPTSYSLHDKGLSTNINYISRDAFGRKLPLSTRFQMWRLKKWQNRSHASIIRNLTQAMSELNRLSDKLSVPRSVKEKAALIYRKALDKGLVQGRPIPAIVAASLYIAYRLTKTPRNLREISQASLVSNKTVSRCYRILLRELEIHVPIVNPTTFLSKVAEKSAISGQTQGLAAKILQEAKEKHLLAGKDPIVMATAALYLACKQSGEKITLKNIANTSGVSDVSVRNRYRTLKKQLKLE